MKIIKSKSSVLLIFMTFLLFFMSSAGFYSIYITSTLSDDAMIINKLGSIRGSIQRIAKLEANKSNSYDIILAVDSTIAEFRTEQINLYDKDNQVFNTLCSIEEPWLEFKEAIEDYRLNPSPGNQAKLIVLSEDLWKKTDSLVYVSQLSSESKLSRFNLSFLLLFINVIISIAIIILIKKHVKDSLEFLVNHDTLTNIFNRKYYTEFMIKEMQLAERYNRPFSVIMLDIDFFKKINDEYGHDIGDVVLKELCQVVQQGIRKTDVFARIGGEEFAIITPETELGSAVILAEKLRCLVENHSFKKCNKVTISLGITQYHPMDNEDSIFKRADVALYKAKSNGRNRSEVELFQVSSVGA